MWVCASVRWRAHVCAGVHMCVQFTYMYVGGCGCTYMYMGVCRCEWVCACVCGCVGYAQVCMGVCGSLRKCTSVCKCVCWMNFQNIFWRLESIHQRTLIRILYEFFLFRYLSTYVYHPTHQKKNHTQGVAFYGG